MNMGVGGVGGCGVAARGVGAAGLLLGDVVVVGLDRLRQRNAVVLALQVRHVRVVLLGGEVLRGQLGLRLHLRLGDGALALGVLLLLEVTVVLAIGVLRDVGEHAALARVRHRACWVTRGLLGGLMKTRSGVRGCCCGGRSMNEERSS